MSYPSSIGNKVISLPAMQAVNGATIVLTGGTANTVVAVTTGASYRLFCTANTIRVGYATQLTAPSTATIAIAVAGGASFVDFQLDPVYGTTLHTAGDNASSAGILVRHSE